MFNKKAVAVAVLASFAAFAAQAEGNRMTLGESLDLDSQISRAELQKKLDEANGRNKQSDTKPDNGAAQASNQFMLNSVSDAAPELESIRGVGNNLRAWLNMGGRRYIVREGDVRDGWKVVQITSDVVKLKRGKKVLEVTFAEALSNGSAMGNSAMNGMPAPVAIPGQSLLSGAGGAGMLPGM